ncbi:MAG TPA: hypothetical protein VM261_15805, partial [Kofleriaceae bacterium]|nr:hypothetical protein [Kofleriaceae bacterium]
GGSVSAAITLYKQLEREFPSDRAVPRVVARRAQIYMRLAWYDEAADDLETYATKWAAEKDAYDALEEAISLRAALGDDDAVAKDVARWVKLFGARKPQEAARAELMLAYRTRERGKPDEAMEAFRTWIKRHGGRADRPQLVAAYAAIGELAWDASCKVKGTAKGALCLAPSRTASAPRCGKPPLVAVARDAALAREAQKAFQTAIRAAESSHDEYALLAAAKARLYLVDAKVEVGMTQELKASAVDASGHMTPASQKELMAWFDAWQAQLGQAVRGYEELLRQNNVRVAVLASARIAWLQQHAADTVASAPLPAWKKPEREELRTAYCDALGQHAEVLNTRAKETADVCLKVGGDVGVIEETAPCVAVFDRHNPGAAGAGERLPAAAWPRVRDVEPAIRYRVTP